MAGFCESSLGVQIADSHVSSRGREEREQASSLLTLLRALIPFTEALP